MRVQEHIERHAVYSISENFRCAKRVLQSHKICYIMMEIIICFVLKLCVYQLGNRC